MSCESQALQRTAAGRRGCHRCVPCAGSLSFCRSGHGNALLAISAASAISAREKRNAQRRRERRGPAVGIESAMDGEAAPTTHAPNKAAPVNAPVAFWFHAGRAWRRVTEQQRPTSTWVDSKTEFAAK